jgi:hypothetical protein
LNVVRVFGYASSAVVFLAFQNRVGTKGAQSLNGSQDTAPLWGGDPQNHALWAWFLICGTAWAGDFQMDSAGVRGGLSAHDPEQRFYQAETFARISTPWLWDLGRERGGGLGAGR